MVCCSGFSCSVRRWLLKVRESLSVSKRPLISKRLSKAASMSYVIMISPVKADSVSPPPHECVCAAIKGQSSAGHSTQEHSWSPADVALDADPQPVL
ncbi:hypothetical protein QQF64_022589 [Cirrhinus molitorella]|uniref:Uncharacterized protein n=1 Tax=Cirrhinus molitorella TaxID=172907 RepID=A0ABR3L2X8_9TELE